MGAKSTVFVPGNLVAEYEDGEVSSWTFTPLAGDAGYFGPAAVLWDGDEGLDLESTDGPFWDAVRDSLAAGGFDVDWVE